MKLAKENLLKSLERLRGSELEEFCSWAREVLDEALEGHHDHEHAKEDRDNHAIECLESIICDLREALPLNAMSNDEKTFVPTTGENEGYCTSNTLHVDSFLYDDDEVDRLTQEGKITNAYCLDCGSKNTRMLNFISHSASVSQLRFLFQNALPDLTGKCVVDVGSRIGAVLYGGYHFSNASRLVGVEFNHELCDITRGMVQKHKLADRIEVVADDVRKQGALLKLADVVVLNNVFEFFLDHDEQATLWSFLRSTLTRKGMYIVAVPSLEESVKNAEASIDLSKWVKEVEMTYAENEDEESDVRNLHLYLVR